MHAVSSRNMYSEQGFEALMRAVFLQVCQRLTVVSYCMPGSPQCQVESAILKQQVAGAEFFDGLAVGDVAGPPVAILFGGAHEVVGDADGVIGVLEEDGAVGVAVDAGVVALLDEHVGLALFLHLAFDEFDDVRVIDVEDHHLGGATSLAAALDDAGEGVETLHEADRTGSNAAAGKSFLAAAQGWRNSCRCRSPT